MKRWAVRLLLAYALLLQGVLGAAAGTLHALANADALATGDAIAGVLCAPSGAGDAGTDVPSHDLLCCTLGCPAAQPAPSLDGAARIILPSPADVATRQAADGHSAPQSAAPIQGFDARGPPAGA